MKRLIIALLVGGMVFGAVFGLAAALNVGFSTLASGSGTVAKCGDVDGVTWLLKGESSTGDGQNVANGTVFSGTPTDITKTTGVNIETILDCVVDDFTDGTPDNGVQVFVQAKDSGGVVVASGTCEVQSHGGVGFDEGVASDNLPGCTAEFAEASIAAIVELVVTMT